MLILAPRIVNSWAPDSKNRSFSRRGGVVGPRGRSCVPWNGVVGPETRTTPGPQNLQALDRLCTPLAVPRKCQPATPRAQGPPPAHPRWRRERNATPAKYRDVGAVKDHPLRTPSGVEKVPRLLDPATLARIDTAVKENPPRTPNGVERTLRLLCPERPTRSMRVFCMCIFGHHQATMAVRPACKH